MAIERFRRSSVGQLRQLPTIRPVAAQEAARSAQSFSQAMDRVSRFAFGQAQEEYQEQAKTEALEIIQEKGAVPAIREIAEKGGPQDLVEETVEAVGNRIATVRIGSMAKNSMSQLILDAEQNKTSYEELDSQINDVVLGFTSALEEYSPEAALEARLELENDATTYKNKYAEAYQKQQLEELQGEALVAYEAERQALIAAATEDVPPEVRQENVAQRRDRIEQLFVDAGYSPKQTQSTLIELDQEVVESQIMMDFNRIESVEEKEAYINNLRENPVPELGVDGTRILRNKLTGELSNSQSARNSTLSSAEDKLDSLINVATAGGEVSNEDLDRLGALADQYPEFSPVYQQGKALIQNVQAFRSMPPTQLQNFINETRSEGFDTEFEAEMVELAETTLTSMQSAANKDPVSAYINYVGADKPSALDLSSVEGMQESIDARVDLGNQAAEFFGTEPKYLTDEEANQFANFIKTRSPTEKAQMALGMNAMPPQVWSQIADKEEGLFAMASAIGDSQIAINVFEGQTLLRDDLVKMPTAEQQLDVVNETLGNVYGEADRKDVISAARAYYAATTESRNIYDKDQFVAALEKITGGIGVINGFKIRLPRNVDENEFSRVINNFSADMVERFGGVQGMSNQEAAELIRDLPLNSEAGNRYFPEQAGQTIIGKNGEPFSFVMDDRMRAMAVRERDESAPSRAFAESRQKDMQEAQESEAQEPVTIGGPPAGRGSR